MKHKIWLVGLLVSLNIVTLGDRTLSFASWKLSIFTNSSGLKVHSVWYYDAKGEQKQSTALTKLCATASANQKSYFLEHVVTAVGGIGFTLLDSANQIFYLFCDGQYDHAIAAGRASAKTITTNIAKPNGTYYARAVIKNSVGAQLNTSILAIAPEKESCNLVLSRVNGQYTVQLEKV